MSRVLGSLAALIGGACLVLGGAYFLVPEPRPVAVLSGSSYPLDARSAALLRRSIEDAVHVRSTQLLDHEIYLDDGSNTFAIAASEMGLFVDESAQVEEILSKLGKEAQRRSPGQRLGHRLLSRPLMVHAELPIGLEESRARDRLERLAPLVNRPAVDAQLLIAEHEIVPSEVGRRLSVEGSLVVLQRLGNDEGRMVDLSIEQIPPSVTEEELAPVDVTRVLSSYETSFKGKAGARAVNIRTAGRYLNGAVILPGEVLSFNDYVGRRIHGRGFVDAPVIVNDEMEQDVGGGVCQVATTLHAAAVFGDLEIVTRRSHSRPSGYAPLGLDATVIDGKVDLRLRNRYDEPLLVYVSFPSDYLIRVELLGRSPEARVKHDYSVTHTEPFARRVWHRPEVGSQGFEQTQKGSVGMDVVSVLSIEHEDGTREKRSYHSKYYPVPEVFWVAEGQTLERLPEPESSVTAVIVDGQDPSSDAGTANETGEDFYGRRGPNEVL